MFSLINISISLAAVIWLIVTAFKVGRREKHLPPGPPTLPLIGNLRIFPSAFAHFQFTSWARTYGDIFSLKIGPGTVIVLSSTAAVKELMDRRSATTADRPSNYIFDQVNGGMNLALARYMEKWRTLRKTAHTILTPQAAAKHLPIQKAEATQLMYDLLKTPEHFYDHIRRYSFSVILSVIYGKRAPRYETRKALEFFHMQHRWETVLAPGGHPPVDLIPIFKYILERWAPWKTMIKEVRGLQRALYFGLLEESEERVAKGTDTGLFLEEVVKRQEEFGLNRELISYLGGILLDAASGTTAGFLQWLIIMFTAFPEIQRKAHEEIDRVIGSQRTPTLDDFATLPYLQAVIKETHRFRPMAPLAIPHAALADEEYRGFIVPKGSTIFVNLWGIFHDPDVYDHPDVFDPDRYLRSEYGTKHPGLDDQDFRHNLIFGSGRRICPGIHLANNSLMLNAMNLTWAFNFSHAVNEESQESIPIDISKSEKGILAPPQRFECSITPRSNRRADLIEREFADAIETFLPFEVGLDKEDKVWLKETRDY